MRFSPKKMWLLDYLHHDNLLLYTLLIKEIENLKTEDWNWKLESNDYFN